MFVSNKKGMTKKVYYSEGAMPVNNFVSTSNPYKTGFKLSWHGYLVLFIALILAVISLAAIFVPSVRETISLFI